MPILWKLIQHCKIHRFLTQNHLPTNQFSRFMAMCVSQAESYSLAGFSQQPLWRGPIQHDSNFRWICEYTRRQYVLCVDWIVSFLSEALSFLTSYHGLWVDPSPHAEFWWLGTWTPFVNINMRPKIGGQEPKLHEITLTGVHPSITDCKLYTDGFK